MAPASGGLAAWTGERGKTPVLHRKQAKALLALTGDAGNVVALRDQALIAVVLFSFARVGALVAMCLMPSARVRLQWRPCDVLRWTTEPNVRV